MLQIKFMNIFVSYVAYVIIYYIMCNEPMLNQIYAYGVPLISMS